MNEESKKAKKKVNAKAVTKKQTKIVNNDINEASIDNKAVDATFSSKKSVSLNETLNNEMTQILDTKKMIEEEKQRLREEYKDLEKDDDREIAVTEFTSNVSKNQKVKGKKTISIEDIACAINAANEKEELERKKKQQQAKKKALKKKKDKERQERKETRTKQKEENKKLKLEKKEKVANETKADKIPFYKVVLDKTKELYDKTLKLFDKKNRTAKETKKAKKEKEEMKKIYAKYFNKNTFLFCTFVVVFLFLFVCMLIPSNKEITTRVRSNLTDTEELSGITKIKADIENYIIVQFPWYEQILDGYFGTLEFSNRKLYQNANDNELILIDSKDGIYIDGDENQLIRKYEVEEKNQDLELGHRIKLFNIYAKILKEKNVNAYIYAVSGIWTSEAILNFELDYKEPLKYVNLFKEKIDSYINFDYLKIIDYTTFKEYFFATDHHWRMHGAYQGYKDVCNLLGIPKDELIKPNFFKVEGVEFLGSNAKICSHDNIIDYLYDIEFDEEFNVEVDGKEIDVDEFSKKNDYLKGDFEKEDIYFNHYGKYFHSDLGEIIYTFSKNKKQNDKDNRNLLIISDSYSNCIDKLIASHFYKTYVVDLRYFESSEGKKFVLEDYIEDNNITDSLVMLSANSIYFESADLDLGYKEDNNKK